MTPGQRRFGRRAFVAGAGAAAAAAYGMFRLAEDLDAQDASRPGEASPPTGAPPYPSDQPATDLTVRWRHLERRARLPHLVAAWQFDEGSGYTFDDVSGNGHPLVITGFEWNTTDSGLLGAIHRRGLRGGAVYLDGTRWLEAAPTADPRKLDGLTVSCWFRPDSLPAGTAVLVGFGVAYTLTLDSAGALILTLRDAAGLSHTVRTPSSTVTPQTWTHVTATASPSTGALDLFVGGVRVATAAAAPFSGTSLTASLVLGGRLTGALDETALYDVALSAADVARLHIVGLPKVFTQTSESMDESRQVFSHYKGSDPVPHPVDSTTVLTQRFAASTTTEQGSRALVRQATSAFVPGVFGGAWRATDNRLSYRSPLSGDSGSFEAWYRPLADPQDPARRRRKEIFTARGRSATLTLYTESGRWAFDVRRPSGRTDTVTADRPQVLEPGTLEHVAVTWGQQAGGANGVALLVNGVGVGFLATNGGDTTYSEQVGLGGTRAAPTYCLLDDVRICSVALPWGAVVPRGQATTEAAGLDLRDTFNRPPRVAPMLWRPGSSGAAWSYGRMTWEDPARVGDDPASARALYQASTVGLNPVFHPDAYGHGSSIEAGVAFPSAIDGWAGLFVQAAQPTGDFSGITFMLNPLGGQLRLARYEAGRITTEKVLPYDFGIVATTRYELTLTSAGDGVVRGFIDGTNVISLRAGSGWPTTGYAGMLTENTSAYFSNLHFCALTPATSTSRVIRTRLIRYGEGADLAALELVPFQWRKRRGLLPWQYSFKIPEPAGNIAGAATALPLRPIPSAAWRSEDSANSDLITLNGRVLYFMRGNPRIEGRPSVGRVGVLYADVPGFDGIHFTDPNLASGAVTGGTLLLTNAAPGAEIASGPGSLQLNAPSTAYVGGGKVLFLGRESIEGEAGAGTWQVVYSRFDISTNAWEITTPAPVGWTHEGGSGTPDQDRRRIRLRGSPELVSLREPDHDTYQAVVFQQTGPSDQAVMATALVEDAAVGSPELASGLPIFTSVSRASGGAIYGFRVMFDNGIYYLHFNDGDHVPDWPDRFVLAAALNPYAGPWVVNPATAHPGSTYFQRGTELEPDNGAVWQGAMFKHRGCYYLYYENYHSIGDVDRQYADLADPQAGSRVGFATA